MGERKAKWQNDYIARTYDRINLTVPKGRKEEIQAEAERRGKSVNGFINGLIDDALERERSQAGEPDSVESVGGGGNGFSEAKSGKSLYCGLTSFSASDSEEKSDLPAVNISDEACSSHSEEQPAPSMWKELASMPKEEIDRRMGCTPEAMERYKQKQERDSERLAYLNARRGGLSRAEEAERKFLLAKLGRCE